LKTNLQAAYNADGFLIDERKEPTNVLHRLFDSTLPIRVSRAIGYAADVPLPQKVLRPIIAAYSAVMGVDMHDVSQPQGGFASFGEFFARRLKSGARPLPTGDDALVSPCDGTLETAFASNDAGAELRIKGNDYSVDELLGGHGESERFAGGGGLVVYLHPRDYHRVHSPCRGELVRVRHIPGTRYPVAHWSEKRVPLLYQRNERVVFFFELPNRSALALTMVAAMGVGDIASPHAPTPAPRESTTRALEPRLPFIAGDEVGAFRLGSTVVLLWSRGAMEMRSDLVLGGKLLQGQDLGRLGSIIAS